MKNASDILRPADGDLAAARACVQTAAEFPGAVGPRAPEDDFFCLRFQLWYPSIDCAYRTRYRTSPSCAACEQGRFNLKRHAAALARRPPFALAD